VLVVTARRFEVLAESGVQADVLVGSANDRGEQYDLGRLAVQPRHVIVTDGERGGTGYRSVPPPAPRVDSYGAGDTFVAGLLFGLADGRPLAEALALAAEQAAEAVTWRGAYPSQGHRVSW
jgi:sugar/nucleoside kinase (ribokinase family)